MIMQGHLDTQLNETGKEQAKLVANALREVAFDKAYSSDLSRAREVHWIVQRRIMAVLKRRQTAKAILAHHPSIQLVEDEALRERVSQVQSHPRRAS